MSNDAPKLQSHGSPQQHAARRELLDLFVNSPIPTEQLLVNLHMYMRSSVVAKFLYVNELYQLILGTPGAILEFGVWWGANLALFESLRGVYEPYNYARKIVGFDTFAGYASVRPEDGTHELVAEGQYAVTSDYVPYLERLLDYHERENTMSHIKKYELVRGDATKTIDQYLKQHPETIISLAYFDMQLYEPTKKCLEAIRPHLTRGSVLAMDELNSDEFPGETVAFREVFGLENVRIQKSRYLPDRAYIILD